MLKTQLGPQKTAAMVTAAATGGAVLVHSVKDRSALANLTASALVQGKSEFNCTSCGTHVIASSHAAPSCTTCGHGTEVFKAAVAPKHKGVVPLRCSHCDTVHLMEPGVVQACNAVHCTVCGGVNTYNPSKIESTTTFFANADEDCVEPPESDAEEVTSAEEWPGDDAEETTAEAEVESELPPVEAAEGELSVEANDNWPFDGEAPAVESSADDDADDEISFEDSGSTEASADADADDEGDDLAIELEDLDTDGAPAVDETVGVDDAGEADELPVEAGETDYEVPDLETGDMLADAMSLDDTADGLSFQATAGRLVAMKGHIAVASLTAGKAGRNADVMMTAGFAAAMRHTAKQHGMRKALSTAGFTPIRIQTLSRASVARKVHEVQQAAVNSSAAKTASFTESLALAAAGMARGSWKGKKNPLKEAFVEAFAQVGVKNPERMVTRVLSEHSVPFTQSLVELASELNSMSPATRKETARILELTQVTSSFSDDDTDNQDDAVASDIEGRLRTTAASLPSVLSTPSVGRRDASRQAVHASATTRALDILNGNAPLMLG